jgi:uncharacterized spore protein YtfJ
MIPQQLLATISERLHTSANVRSIYGEPIVANGKTVVPIARIAYGFGAGGGEGSEKSQAHGGGGGGAVSVYPVGVLEISSGGTRFVPFTNKKQLAAAMCGGFLLGVWTARRRLAARNSASM